MFRALVSSTSMFHRNWLIGWLLIFSLISSAFVPSSVASLVSSPVDGHTFILAISIDADTLDPALAYDTTTGEVVQNIYETLVFYDGENTNSFVPQLASSYELSGDGLTWTFHVRPNVTFHNGASLTASDVAYSFQRGLLQGGSGSPQWLLAEPFLGTGVYDIALVVDPTGQLVDDRVALSAWNAAELAGVCQQVKSAIVADDVAGTVTMHLAQPWGPFLSTISGTWGSIMDKTWTVNHGGWDGSCNTWQNWYAMTSDQDPLTTVTNGTGPFKLDHWTPGQEIVLARNNNYWRAPAQLEGVVIQIVPDDNARFSMLQTGNIYEARPVGNTPVANQMVGEDCLWNINTSQYDCSVIDTAKSLKRYKGRPDILQTHLLLNFDITVPDNPYIGSGQLNGNGIPSDFFSDVHIRKAFNYCFDWDTFDQIAYGGTFVQGTTLVLQGMPGYDLNAPHYTTDLSLCETQLGLADLDHDGIPSINDTNDVTQVGFHFQVPYNTGNLVRQTIAQIFAANFSQVDPKFVIDAVSIADYGSAQNAGFLPLMTAGWVEDIHDSHNWYQPYLVGSYSNRAHIPDELKTQFNTLITQGVSATDFATRDTIYKQLNQLVYNNAPLIILGGATNLDFIQRGVGGQLQNQAFMGNYYYPIHIESADIDVTVGTTLKGNYDLVHFKGQRVSYAALNSGPVKLENIKSFPIVASQRVIFGGVSYSEMMGLPLEQLSKEYWFPYYNNVAMDSQLRVSNLGNVPTTINVYLGSDPNPIDSYTLAAGTATRKNYTGKNAGPLKVTSSATNILSTIRVLYGSISYSEMMGLPVEQLTKEYLFPYYNNVAMNSQLRVSNVGGADTTINVYLGSDPTPIDSYTLGAGGATRKNYTGKNGGPLRVTSSVSNILTTIRVLYAGSSYSELMGYPSTQLAQEYWYPVYDNGSLDSQLRVSNVGTGPTTITVYAGGTQIDSYSLGAGGAIRKNYPQNTGPLHVVSSAEPILSTIRMLYSTPSFSSFYEITGLAGTQLSRQYFFPWYNNVAMNSELRFAVP